MLDDARERSLRAGLNVIEDGPRFPVAVDSPRFPGVAPATGFAFRGQSIRADLPR